EQGRFRADPIQAEGSVANFIKQIQILNGGVIDAIRRPNAGLARSSGDFIQKSIMEIGRVCHSGARREIVISRRRKRAWNPGVSRHNPTLWCSREYSRLQTGNNGLNLALR